MDRLPPFPVFSVRTGKASVGQTKKYVVRPAERGFSIMIKVLMCYFRCLGTCCGILTRFDPGTRMAK